MKALKTTLPHETANLAFVLKLFIFQQYSSNVPQKIRLNRFRERFQLDKAPVRLMNCSKRTCWRILVSSRLQCRPMSPLLDILVSLIKPDLENGCVLYAIPHSHLKWIHEIIVAIRPPPPKRQVSSHASDRHCKAVVARWWWQHVCPIGSMWLGTDVGRRGGVSSVGISFCPLYSTRTSFPGHPKSVASTFARSYRLLLL
jgi:hypothetical protein